MVQLPVSLVRGRDQHSVEARLLDLQPKHVADFQSLWQAQLRQFSQEDKYWDWAFKERLTIQDVNYEGYAVEYEGRTQGLMVLETQWHSSLSGSKAGLCGRVIGRALESAPHSEPTSVQDGRQCFAVFFSAPEC